MGKIIGIDLGTTNSVVAIMDGKEPKVIANEEGHRLTPSVVGFDEKGEVLVGQLARRQAVVNPENTVYSVKRFMGRRFDEVKSEAAHMPYKVMAAANGDAAVEIRGKRYSPPEISARVLGKLKRAAEEFLGEKVTEAVITVPAYFNDAQRQATRDAGRIAGLDVKRIVNEPTAAALAYGLDKGKEHYIAVFDFGGGTFDVSILEIGEKVVEVISTNGDTHLGGDDLDQRIIDWLISEFKRENGIDVSKDKMALQRLKEEAEKAKIELSSVMETEINIPFLTADQTGPKHLRVKLSRSKFEQMVGDLLERTLEPTRKALADAGKTISDISEVVLVGGSTRIPKVQQLVKDFFKKDPHKGVNPDEVVALGAAVQAGVLSGEVKDILLLDVTPLTLGIETKGGIMVPMIPRNTTIPTKKTEVFTTAVDGQTSVNIIICQGERTQVKDNKLLGQFSLSGIPPAPQNVPQIEVTFDIDANGIVHVTAKDKGTGKEQKIQIANNSGLTEAEIQRMVKDAELHQAEDKARKEVVEASNQLDHSIYEAEKMLKENADKIPADVKANIEREVESAKQVHAANKEGNDAKVMQDAEKQLRDSLLKAGEALYQASGAAGSNAAAGSTENSAPKTDDTVIDAEFTEQKNNTSA